MLQLVQDDVVHRDHRGADDRHAPVAIHQQKREPAEDVEVHLDHAAGLMDDQTRVQHDGRRDRHPRQELSGREACAQHGDAAQRAADQEGGHPRSADRREGQGEHEMADQ